MRMQVDLIAGQAFRANRVNANGTTSVVPILVALEDGTTITKYLVKGIICDSIVTILVALQDGSTAVKYLIGGIIYDGVGGAATTITNPVLLTFNDGTTLTKYIRQGVICDS